MSIRHFLLIFLMLAADARAEVQESLEYTYYHAIAKPGQSLVSSLNAASPVNEKGRVFHGYTKWNVRWNFSWIENRDGTCKITTTKTSVTGSITLPRLAGANPEQQAVFERYAAALKQHELGHYQIGKDAAATIDQALLDMPPMRNCTSLDKVANDGAYQALERYKEKERLYDANTEHGKSQGAWLTK